jgi:DNA repair protein RadA/Sms
VQVATQVSGNHKEARYGAPRVDAATVAPSSAPTRESAVPSAPPPTLAPRSEPIRITLAEAEIHERIVTTIEPLDRVLGGGLVVGSIVLLGGEPGQGKSTLIAQALAKCNRRCLYVTGEESIGQATMRAQRVNATTDQIWIVNETDVDVVIAHARDIRPDVLAIDSIQTCVDATIGGVPGSVNQVRACGAKLAAFAKAEGIATILVGHVTKDGSLAGPKTLEHLVDATLSLEESEYFATQRVLRAFKNRFGSTQELGAFVMHAHGLAALEPEAPPAEASPLSAAPAPADEGNLS